MCMGAHVSWQKGRGQRKTAFRNWFSSSTRYALMIVLRWSGLVASIFTCWAVSLASNKKWHSFPIWSDYIWEARVRLQIWLHLRFSLPVFQIGVPGIDIILYFFSFGGSGEWIHGLVWESHALLIFLLRVFPFSSDFVQPMALATSHTLLLLCFCLCVCLYAVCIHVLSEVRRRSQRPWDWSYGW